MPPREHALLSASSAHRWIKCPPLARIEEMFPDETSPFAEEGTRAHALAELRLSRYIGKHIEEKPMKITAEMNDYVMVYVDYCTEKYNESLHKDPNTLAAVERKLDFSRWVPEGFGTGDFVIVNKDSIHVLDLKYGAGVPVSAVGNPQLRLYALGALNEYGMLYDFKTIHITIIQPRLNNVSTDKLDAKELLDWGENVVKPAAKLAYDGEGEFVYDPETFRFSKIKAVCKERADYNLSLEEFQKKNPHLLTDDELADILERATELERWVHDVKWYLLNKAIEGKPIKGYKLVEGRSNRSFSDENKVREALEIFYDEDTYNPRAFLSVSQMETALGKKAFTSLLKEFVVKSPGKPTLVKDTDKRPAMDPTASAIADFSD